jgi:hypothetical protein
VTLKFGALGISSHENIPVETPIYSDNWVNLPYLHLVWEAGLRDTLPGGITDYRTPQYSYWTGSSYTTSTILGPSGARRWDTLTLKRDQLNRLHFANWQVMSNQLLYWRKEGGSNSWTMSAIYSGNGRFASTTTDANGYPHISHIGDTSLKYARWAGGDDGHLRVTEDGTTTTNLASDQITSSPLKFKGVDGNIYGAPLVGVNDELASKVRVSLGTNPATDIRAIQKLP